MMRVSERTRDRVAQLAAEDFGGVTADEALGRLIDVYWQSKVIAAVDDFYAHDPSGWADYVRDADEWDARSAPAAEPWSDAVGPESLADAVGPKALAPDAVGPESFAPDAAGSEAAG
jgi:hypothetical protein